MKRFNALLLTAWVLTSVAVLLRFRLDYWDGFNFLLQARALSDPAYREIAFDAWRPRGLVGLLAIFNYLTQRVTGEFPGLRAYHLLMLSVSVSFLFAWRGVFKKLWGARSAQLGMLLMLLCPLIFHYAFSLLADLYTGLFWGLAVALYLSQRPSGLSAFGAGSLGALAGLGKYHYLPLFPTFIALLFLFRWKNKRPQATAPLVWALVGFLLTAEIGLRLTAPPGWGLLAQCRSILTQASASFGWHSPWTLYAEALLTSLGWPFWIATAALALTLKILRSQWDERASALIGTTLLFFAINQLYPHREIRYLLPLLPALLGLCAWTWTQWQPRRPIAWSLTLALVLCWPAIRLGQEARNYLTDPVYDTASLQLDGLWPQLHSCTAVHACLITLRAQHSEYPDDPYYRSYDLGPHYTYFTRVPTSIERCAEVQALRELPASFFQRQSPGQCYIVATRAPGKAQKIHLLREAPAPQLGGVHDLPLFRLAEGK